MIAVLFLLLTFLSCLGIVQKIWHNTSPPLVVALTTLLSMLASSWLGLLFSWILGYTLGISLLITCLCGLLFVFPPHLEAFQKWKSPAVFLLYVIVGTTLFALLFERAFFAPTPEGWTTLLYSYGDLALHSTYINYFAQQAEFSWQSPLYSQAIINYPFLINFYTALLVKMGLTVRIALIVSSLQIIVAGLIGFYFLVFNITKKVISPLLAFLLFFFNGGARGSEFFADWMASSKNLWDFSTQLTTDYAHNIPLGYFWSNSITTHLLPQRGFLFGFLFLTTFLLAWQQIWYNKRILTSQLFFISCITGLLPLFHTHTYLVVFPLLVWLSGNLWYQKRITLQTLSVSLSPALLLGALQLIMLSPEKNFIALQLGWMAEDNFLSFWWKNMGVSLLLLVASPMIFWRTFSKRTLEKKLLLPALAIFVICNLFIFQPNEWDNMKFFMLSYVIIAVIAASILTHFWTSFINKITIILIVLACSWSGLLSVVYIYTHPTILASLYDLHVTQFVKQTPVNSVFLTADSHNHPVSMLAGRPIVLGYRGWLWTHGVDYKKTEADVKVLYQGRGTPEMLAQYNVDYIIVGPHEKRVYKAKVSYFQKNFPVVYEDGITTMYKVR